MSRASASIPASPFRGWSSSGGVRTITFGDDQPLHLSSGEKLAPLTIGYETYGELAPD